MAALSLFIIAAVRVGLVERRQVVSVITAYADKPSVLVVALLKTA
jgi:hypothetical protein